MRAICLVFVMGGCAADAAPETIRTFDPCAPIAVAAPAASLEQQASLDDAIAMWHARGVVGLSRAEPATIDIAFRDAAASIYGYYDDVAATVYVNAGLDRAHAAVTIAHELGHALGLPHVERAERASVMNPGNLTIAPTPDDARELVTLWGACER